MLSKILNLQSRLIIKTYFHYGKIPLDINLFRLDKNNPGNHLRKVKKSLQMRYRDIQLADQISELDEEYRKQKYEIDQTRKVVNKLSKELGIKIKNEQNVQKQKEQLNRLQQDEKLLKDNLVKTQKLLVQFVLKVGNIVHQNSPVSNDQDNNKIIQVFGNELKKQGTQPYWSTFDKIDGIDLKRGQKISGHRGYFLKNAGFKLARALTNYSLDFLQKQGYTMYQPPVMIKQQFMKQCCQLSTLDQDVYKLTGEENVLIATSQQSLASMYRQQTIQQKLLPLRLGGYSLCFRKQAGAHGKDNQGIFRVHHFEKIQQFYICKQNQSQKYLEIMLNISKRFYQQLKIPYQIVQIVSGALNDAANRKYDLQGWFPHSNKYRQLVSVSNCTDYQSRMLQIKYRQKNQNKYVHMLNGTLCAIERTLCCIIQNNTIQTGVKIPDVLIPYYGSDLISFKS